MAGAPGDTLHVHLSDEHRAGWTVLRLCPGG
jgi:hypothetical protein